MPPTNFANDYGTGQVQMDGMQITRTTLTAHAGGGATGATQLVWGLNLVSVATAADSVVLPDASQVLPGTFVYVICFSSNALAIFPFGAQTINRATSSVSLPAQDLAIFISTGPADWQYSPAVL